MDVYEFLITWNAVNGGGRGIPAGMPMPMSIGGSRREERAGREERPLLGGRDERPRRRSRLGDDEVTEVPCSVCGEPQRIRKASLARLKARGEKPAHSRCRREGGGAEMKGGSGSKPDLAALLAEKASQKVAAAE
jgi:hypothetical protein